jgi:fermentation-respiration switch protein FrsA (DUF1100 family)
MSANGETTLMEIFNYIFEAACIIGVLYLGFNTKTEPFTTKQVLRYALTILIFAAVHYLMLCWMMGGTPIFLEILFHFWMLCFAVSLGRILQHFWRKVKKGKIPVIILCSTLFVFFVFGVLNSRRAKIDAGYTPKRYSYNYKEIVKKTADNIPIRMWHINNHLPTKKLALVCHGVGANLSDAFPYALIFLHSGYDVLMFDWRGHGKSGSHRIEFGEIERNDLTTVLNYLKTQDYEFKVALGASMGGGNLIKNWDLLKQQNFNHLVLDSSFSDVREAIVYRLKFLPIPRSIKWCMAEGVGWLTGLILNYKSVTNPPLANCHKLKDTKVLIFHGEQDGMLPVKCAKDIYSKLDKSKATLHLFKGCDHLQGVVKRRREFREKLAEFLKIDDEK